MSARSFRSVFMVASCAGAALGCYLVSLNVASERAALEDVESQIVMAQRDIRLLQTEIGTRGRLAQLERWNVKVLALSAQNADQFVQGGFEFARLVAPQKVPAVEAPVVLASASADAPRPQLEAESVADAADGAVPTRQLLHAASLKQQQRNDGPIAKLEPSKRASAPKSAEPAPVKQPAKASAAKAQAPKGQAGNAPPAKEPAKASAKPSQAPAKKTVDKQSSTGAKAMTKAVRLAKTDPLAPLPAKSNSAKDSGPAR
jgi:hypothetical protein